MPYGILKVDTITFTDNSVDKSVSLSGLIQNPTFTGNVTATGTISGAIIAGTTATFGNTTVTGNLTLNAQGDLRLADADSSNYIGFQAAATVPNNVIFTLPSGDGTAGQALVTNGSAILGFASAGGGTSIAQAFFFSSF